MNRDSIVSRLLGLAEDLDYSPRNPYTGDPIPPMGGEIYDPYIRMTDTCAKSIAAALRKIALDVRELPGNL